MSSLAVNFLGIPMASPLIGASGTVGFGLELAKFIDMKKIGAISGKGLAKKSSVCRHGNCQQWGFQSD